jgi:DNA-binding transcriptional MerR regulator
MGMKDAARNAVVGVGDEETGSVPERLLTIGQLVRELHAEFPDLSISKVRYLEDRGLLSPLRTKSLYRKYSKADVRALRGILSMQREEYLPLEVIRQRVERTGSAAAARSGVDGGTTSRLAIRLGREELKYTQEGLCEAAGVDEEFVLRLGEFRLVVPSRESGPAFTESDLDTVRVCHRLSRFEVEPRNLRMLSSAAERGAALVEQVATPSLRSAHNDRKEYGVETVEELGSLFSQLMHLLLRRELQRLL